MRKLILAPSILSADFANLGADIAKTADAGAEYIHFDVMDGQFVPNISFGIPVLKSVRKATEAFLDVHLMITKPERFVKQFVEAGADMVTFHTEATEEIAACIRMIREAGARAGLVIKPKTPVSAVLPYLKELDMVLLMSVEPGFGGQSFIPDTLDKIRELRAACDASGIDPDIEVDGGVHAGNAADCIRAGANVLVAGSAVFKGDITGNTQNILEAMGGAEQA